MAKDRANEKPQFLRYQEPLPILRFTIQFPWKMKSGNSAGFAEKHEVRKACSEQVQKVVTSIYGEGEGGGPDPANQAFAGLAGLIIAIQSYIGDPNQFKETEPKFNEVARALGAVEEQDTGARALGAAAGGLAKAAGGLAKAAGGLATAAGGLATAAEALGKAVDDFAKAKDECAKAAEALGKAADECAKAKDECAKAAEALGKAADECAKAAKAPAKALGEETADKLAKALGETADKSDKVAKAHLSGLKDQNQSIQKAAILQDVVKFFKVTVSLKTAKAALANEVEFNEDSFLTAARKATGVGVNTEDEKGIGGSVRVPPASLTPERPLSIKPRTWDHSIPVNVRWPVVVKKKALCLVDLDVEIATKEPGWATASGVSVELGQGHDLDNLLKTICDGLRFPGDANANPDAETCISIAEGRPFFCLVEDDALIRQLNSRLTVLIGEPTCDKQGAGGSTASGGTGDAPNARVTIHVVVSSYRFPNFSGNAAPSWSPDIKGMLTPLA